MTNTNRLKIDKKKIKIITNGSRTTTNGLNTFGHKEFAINLALPQDLSETIIFGLIDKMNRGEDIEDKCLYDICTCPINTKTKNDYLIIIFPDPLMRFPWDENCQNEYKNQI